MRLPLRALAVLVGLSIVTSAVAQVPKSLFIGTTRHGLFFGNGAWCSIDLGATTFRRLDTASATISLTPVHYGVISSDHTTYATLAGELRLVFQTSGRGTIEVDSRHWYGANLQRLTFSRYSQIYSVEDQRLAVSFLINFPNCSVEVSNVYRN
jgi:hypothetical protein